MKKLAPRPEPRIPHHNESVKVLEPTPELVDLLCEVDQTLDKIRKMFGLHKVN